MKRWMLSPAFCLLVSQIGCDGGPPQLPAPTVMLSALPTTITQGQSTTLTWSSTNATSCTASNAWSGPEQTSGSTSVTPTSSGNITYTLTCSGSSNGSGQSSAVVAVNPAPPPAALGFAPIPSVTLSLGTKITPVDLSQYVQGGVAPFTFSLASQSMPTAVNCSLGGSTISSDYAYFGGVNVLTVEVTDSKQATASGIITVTVAVPVVASPIYGIDFSPYENGQTPQSGGALSIDEITQRMGVIAPYVKWVRVYRSSGGEENSGAIAHKFGLKACLGAGIGSDTSPDGINEIQMTNLIAHAQNGEADCAVIGTEALFRGDVTSPQLISYIDRFRAAVPNVPVATADTYPSLLKNPDVVNDCDFVFANYYPYWESQDISIAVSYLNSADGLLRHTYPGKEILVSETGWPSGGNTLGDAVPSLTNAAAYFLNFESWAQAGKRKSFYFEVFDEAWKATSEAPQQALFGVFDANGIIKYGNDVFSGTTVPDNWTCTTIPGGTGTAAIQFTSVPPIGSTSMLMGQVSHVNPASYYVVVYIHVPGFGWWVKPFATAPLTFVKCDGTWTANIVTGGSDASADQITAFLIPPTYNPPILQGAGTLPADLLNNAVASVSVNRP